MPYKGLDVSHVPSYQRNITVDIWNKIRNAGYSFVILKAGGSDDGHYVDAAFEKNYRNAKAAGLNVGAYYIVGRECTTSAAGALDADFFIDILKGKQFEYPVFIDFEVPGRTTRNGNTDAVIAFYKKLRAAGYWTGVYSSATSGFKERLDDSRLQGYTHWVADYRGECKYDGKVGADIWQYTSSGKVPGINGDVDLDISYVNFPAKIKAKGLNGFKKTVTRHVTRTDIVNAAKFYLGCVRGDARHREIVDIFNTVEPDGWSMNYTASWCATFVSAIMIKLYGKGDVNRYFPLSASCGKIIAKARDRGIWVENDGYIPKPGDWIIYDWEDSGVGDDTTGHDHIGIVESVDGGEIKVIEGNKHNRCDTRIIKVNGRYIRGFVCPKYEEIGSGVVESNSTATNKQSSKIAVDGKWGRQTTLALRKKLGFSDGDGYISHQPTSNRKHLHAIDSLWWKFEYNPNLYSSTIEALQKKINIGADGYIGYNTIIMLQKFLNRDIHAGLTVDGSLGPLTVKALQKWINE